MGQITQETVRCIEQAFERKDPDGGFPLTSWEKVQLAAAWSEREAARGYAIRLAEAIWRKHYKGDSPHWRPFESLMGVLTQIDNMVAGMAKLPDDAHEPQLRWCNHCGEGVTNFCRGKSEACPMHFLKVRDGVMLNGLTDAETSATASVAGLPSIKREE